MVVPDELITVAPAPDLDTGQPLRAQDEHSVLERRGDGDRCREVDSHHVVDTVREVAVGAHVVHHSARRDDDAIAGLFDAFDVAPDGMVVGERRIAGARVDDLPHAAEVRGAVGQRLAAPCSTGGGITSP